MIGEDFMRDFFGMRQKQEPMRHDPIDEVIAWRNRYPDFAYDPIARRIVRVGHDSNCNSEEK